MMMMMMMMTQRSHNRLLFHRWFGVGRVAAGPAARVYMGCCRLYCVYLVLRTWTEH